MVGSALQRRLRSENCTVLTVPHSQMDLRDQLAVAQWFENNRPAAVFVAAAKVGGIQANDKYPAEFLYDNLMIEANIIHSAHMSGVEKLLFLGSSCIYPKLASQPISEGALLSGYLEPTNEWYAIAKIAGIKLCQSYRKQFGRHFIAAMPTNLYGPEDNFDLENSHAVPALIRKAHEATISAAKSLTVWGSGKPYREFLHVDDCADGLVYLMKHYDDYEHVNIGYGDDLSIDDLAKLICKIVGFKGEIMHDTSRADGTPRKLMSSAKLRALGWEPAIPLETGLRLTYQWFLEHNAAATPGA